MQSLLTALPFLGRDLIGFYFVYFGVWAIYHWKPYINILVDKKIPHPFMILPVLVGWQIIAGGLIMSGLYVRLAALCLIPYILINVFLYHDFWNHQTDARRAHLAMFMSNLTITFGSLFMLFGNLTPLSQWSDILLP